MAVPYTKRQIGLHWVIFVLIAVQYLLHEPISEAWDKVEKGLSFEFNPLIAAHVAGGILILLLVVWRLVLRARFGAPPLPEKEPPLMKLAAHITHIALYALMVLLPVSGAVAWFGGVHQAAEAHEVMRALLLLLVLLHVLAALFHQFVLKTNIMARIKRPG